MCMFYEGLELKQEQSNKQASWIRMKLDENVNEETSEQVIKKESKTGYESDTIKMKDRRIAHNFRKSLRIPLSLPLL